MAIELIVRLYTNLAYMSRPPDCRTRELSRVNQPDNHQQQQQQQQPRKKRIRDTLLYTKTRARARPNWF